MDPTPGVSAAGVMHTPSNLVSEAVAKIGEHFAGPIYAYPDSGYFEMPNWRFEDVITPEDLAAYAGGWIDQRIHAIGGCCGLTPAHIEAIAEMA